MKRIVAGVFLGLILCCGYAAFAALPSFIASALWSSDMVPDPDYIEAVDADFLAASPDLIITDEETMDEEVPEEEPAEEVQADVIPEEEPLVVTQPEIEEQVIATPDKAVEDEVIADAVKVEIDEGEIATPDEAMEDEVVIDTEGAIQ